ncbi:MAG: FtsX-like permease family protein, partial [Planctomycetes bacterium]|nr:FtsX-like permease family protein [Planctomycetota bacterium]
QAVFPLQIISGLMERFIGPIATILLVIAVMIVVVAAVSIVVGIYNSMNERRREFAILRALGARRGTVFSAIVLESTVIAGLGCLVGYAVYAVILGVAAVIVKQQTGVVLDVTSYHPALWETPVSMTVIGALSGLLPAWNAYRTDVADNLSPTS